MSVCRCVPVQRYILENFLAITGRSGGTIHQYLNILDPSYMQFEDAYYEMVNERSGEFLTHEELINLASQHRIKVDLEERGLAGDDTQTWGRKIASLTKENVPLLVGKGDVRLTVQKLYLTNEWVVRYHENDWYNEDKSYFTSNKEDALETMKDMFMRL